MIRIEQGLPGQDRPKAASMFWEAFGGKMSRCLGPKAKGLKFVQDQMRQQFCFSAYDGAKLVGIAGFKTDEGGFVGGSYRDIAQTYGYVSAIWRSAAMSRFERELEEGQLLLDGLCVTQHARGQGIGTALLEQIEIYARFELCRNIRLDVVDTNTRAKALYERNGYIASGTIKAGMMKPLIGFKSATTMIKTL